VFINSFDKFNSINNYVAISASASLAQQTFSTNGMAAIGVMYLYDRAIESSSALQSGTTAYQTKLESGG
jgi:hypothetical protein